MTPHSAPLSPSTATTQLTHIKWLPDTTPANGTATLWLALLSTLSEQCLQLLVAGTLYPMVNGYASTGAGQCTLRIVESSG